MHEHAVLQQHGRSAASVEAFNEIEAETVISKKEEKNGLAAATFVSCTFPPSLRARRTKRIVAAGNAASPLHTPPLDLCCKLCFVSIQRAVSEEKCEAQKKQTNDGKGRNCTCEDPTRKTSTAKESTALVLCLFSFPLFLLMYFVC